MKIIIAIDPGLSGGIAWQDDAGKIHAKPMPEDMTSQADLIREIVGVRFKSLLCAPALWRNYDSIHCKRGLYRVRRTRWRTAGDTPRFFRWRPGGS